MSLLRSFFPRVSLSTRIPTRAYTNLHRPLPRPQQQQQQQHLRSRLLSTGSTGPATPKKDSFPILPLIAILVGGSGLFYYLVQQRKGTLPEGLKSEKREMLPEPKPIKQIVAPEGRKPAFNEKEVTVIFVLGGPGAGKGTQCANLVRDYNFAHFSAGDLLRAEQQREGSEFGELIKTYIREGKIVPMEVTVALLENAMRATLTSPHNPQTKFLIDGFPRQMDQALKFESDVCPSKLTLFFDTSEETMLKRLLKRAETSGRDDDNIESIRKRFRTFVETSMPVVNYYEKSGKVVRVDASTGVEEVYSEVQRRLAEVLGLKNGGK